MESNYFIELNSINVNDKVESKNGLKYLSWSYAWGKLKEKFPKSYYTVYENKDQLNYFHDGITAWVKTGVTVVLNDGYSLEHIEYLPIMDYKNKSIPLANITSFDVNKAIQRSLTKAVARHGLGLYIYAGEDLPEEEQPSAPSKEIKKETKKVVEKPKSQIKEKTIADMSLSEALVKQCDELKVDLNKLSIYLKKKPTQLTNEDLSMAIKMKIDRMEKGAN